MRDPSTLRTLAQAALRAHNVVLRWHLANPGQDMPPGIEQYAVLMADLQDHIHKLNGGPADLVGLVRGDIRARVEAAIAALPPCVGVDPCHSADCPRHTG